MPMVIMFISNEAAFRAAMTADPSLYDDARQKRIFLTSPQTIVPMIHLIRLAWQQQTLAENAEELGRVVEELGSRLFTFMDHLQGLGKSLSSTVSSWDRAVGSWDTRITPQLDRVRDLGGKLKDSPELAPIGKTPRLIEKAGTAPSS
jgi:DNA recombination protein RmuC